MSPDSKTTEPTDEQVDAAILAALADAGRDDVHPWAAIRRRVPGSHDRKGDRLVALWLTGRVWLCKVRGRNYVALGDADDERIVAAAGAAGRVRSFPVL
ncbi:hypothetical protein [Mycolicibacterium gilvum]|uniref:Uncharacterized protein n=1 Tax=Mycolicibacterium gilvum TaxID=1804 RepID=A0A378SIN8_9MYCO|nr:hypothetical protein [Mycolicibacterium gilvum]MCV7057752.1 hypothetical protein [Mycolicibacterium gilvum]STZ42570.1 Uncharacterised protein [Mycolicibacterium gilvum]